MEARKLRLSTLVVCRFCLVSDENLHNLYDYDKANTQIKLNLKILSCISVEIFPSDHMPQFICNRCIHFMETYFAYKQICRQADESIMRYLEKGTTLKPIPWPPGLKKIFDKKRAVKTLEDGTTVQLSYPDGFDSDEEGDHDFYNVKIGQDQAACIKIVSEDKKKKSRQPAASKKMDPAEQKRQSRAKQMEDPEKRKETLQKEKERSRRRRLIAKEKITQNPELGKLLKEKERIKKRRYRENKKAEKTLRLKITKVANSN